MKKILISEKKKKVLEKGLCSTTNLLEALSVDLQKLFKHFLPELPPPFFSSKDGIVKKMQVIAQTIHNKHGLDFLDQYMNHSSDIIRGWGCFLVGYSSLNLKESLIKMKPLIIDKHFFVREWAWLALRPKISHNLIDSFQLLRPFIYHSSEFMRRFAIEISRPRGVWSKHINELKEKPWLGLTLLEPLKKDPSRYVQNSVGNWLNDAGKTRSEWVLDITNSWAKISFNPYTQYIIKRARRNLF